MTFAQWRAENPDKNPAEYYGPRGITPTAGPGDLGPPTPEDIPAPVPPDWEQIANTYGVHAAMGPNLGPTAMGSERYQQARNEYHKLLDKYKRDRDYYLGDVEELTPDVEGLGKPGENIGFDPNDPRSPYYRGAGAGGGPSGGGSVSGPQNLGGLRRVGRDIRAHRAAMEGRRAGGLRDLYAAREARANAIDAAAKTGAAKAAEIAAYKREAHIQQQQMELDHQRREDKRQIKMAQAMNKLEEMQNEFNAQTIDPDRWWNSRSNAQRAMAVLGQFFGALGSGLTGTPNETAAMLQRMIDRDLMAQKANIDIKGKALAGQTNIVQMMRSQFGDERAADAAAKIAATNATIRQVDLIASRYQANEVQDQAQAVKAQLQQQVAGEVMKFQESMDKSILASLQAEGNVHAQRQAAAARWAQIGLARQRLAAKQQGQNLLPRGVEAMPGKVIPKKEAEQARKIVSNWRAAREKLIRTIKWRGEYGTEWLPSGHYNQAKADVRNALALIKEMKNMGAAMTETEKLLMAIEEDPGAIGFLEDQYKQVLRNLDEDVERYLYTNHMRHIGGMPGSPKYGK